MASAWKVVVGILLLPFFLLFAFISAFSVLFYLVTLIGPLYHLYRSGEEKRLLDPTTLVSRHRDMKILRSSRGRIVYRYTRAVEGKKLLGSHEEHNHNEGSSLLVEYSSHIGDGPIDEDVRIGGHTSHPKKYPVVLPGGLGSTLALTSFQHDRLVQQGYDVLSFDRLGVGYSDNPDEHGEDYKSSSGSILDHIKEMNEVMMAVDSQRPWIVVGGSFGCTVGQLYTALHPDRVAGFVNMDGLPYYLSHVPGVRESFASVALIYQLEAKLSAIGLFRFPLWAVWTLKDLRSVFTFKDGISAEEAYAQMQSSRLLETIGKETNMMMETCDEVTKHWGELSFHGNRVDEDRLASVAPAYTITDEMMRACTAEETVYANTVAAELREVECDETDMIRRWKSIPVRSISCRNYFYDPMEQFMTSDMKKLYAAEHTFLSLLSLQGERVVFPDVSHTGILTLTPHLIRAVNQVSDLAAAG